MINVVGDMAMSGQSLLQLSSYDTELSLTMLNHKLSFIEDDINNIMDTLTSDST